VDAARIEPVSTPNSLLAGNLAGNFLKKGPPKTILASKTRAASIAYEQIPCSTEQGIFLHKQGILSCEQGILEFCNFALGRFLHSGILGDREIALSLNAHTR
jgi:hypothetical protein